MKKVVLIIVVLCALGAVLYFAVSIRDGGDKATNNAAIPVAVAVVKEGSISDELSLTGNIEAISDVDLYSKIAGRLEELGKDVGDKVGKGEVLARIDDREIEARLNQAKAELAVAKAELKKAMADLHKAKKDKDRALRLYERGVESEYLFDQADTAYKSALASHELAESNVWKMEAYLEQARILMDEATIESPIEGVVAQRYVDAGDMISLTTAILKIVNVDTVDVVVSVPEVKISSIKVGSPVNIKVDAYPSESFTGKVARISPWVDLHTRTSKVEVSIENPKHYLKPGMFARVTIELQHRRDVPLIPKDAVLLIGGDSAVFVVDGDVARLRKVRTGLERGNLVEVVEGIERGQRIIVRGQSVASDGKRVEVVREDDIR